jgi:hypothetical protein
MVHAAVEQKVILKSAPLETCLPKKLSSGSQLLYVSHEAVVEVAIGEGRNFSMP